MELPSEEDLKGKKVSDFLFFSRSYEREEIWLTFYKAREGRRPLCPVSEKPEEPFLKFVKESKYQYNAGLTTFVSTASTYYGTWDLETMLEDCRLRPFCLLKLAESGKPITK